MTPVLYMIVYMQMLGADRKKSRECHESMRKVVDEWMQNPGTHTERTSRYGILRSITNIYYYTPDNDRKHEKEFLWFKQQLSDWAALMNNEGCWNGISSSEALCRIEVMSRNSNMFLDTFYDGIVEKARANYCQSILGSMRRSDGKALRNYGLTLFMLYEVMMWGVGIPDYELVNQIAESAKHRAEQYPYGSDEWLLCQSTVLDRLCMQVNEEIQERLFANIA